MPVFFLCAAHLSNRRLMRQRQHKKQTKTKHRLNLRNLWLTPGDVNVFTAAGGTNTPNLSSCKKTVWISVFISVNTTYWTRNYTIQCFWSVCVCVCVCVCTTWKRSCIFSHPRTSFAQLEHQHKHNNRIINSNSEVVRELLLSPKCCSILK